MRNFDPIEYSNYNRMLEYSFPRLFVPWNIRSHDGTFVLGTIRSLELSFPGPFVPWTICSRYRILRAKFITLTTTVAIHRSCKMMIFKAKVLGLPVKNKIA